MGKEETFHAFLICNLSQQVLLSNKIAVFIDVSLYVERYSDKEPSPFVKTIYLEIFLFSGNLGKAKQPGNVLFLDLEQFPSFREKSLF